MCFQVHRDLTPSNVLISFTNDMEDAAFGDHAQRGGVGSAAGGPSKGRPSTLSVRITDFGHAKQWLEGGEEEGTGGEGGEGGSKTAGDESEALGHMRREMARKDFVMRSVVGTITFCCPEIVQHECYTEKADIWSLGCILYNVMLLKPPFRSTNVFNIASKIVEGQFDPPLATDDDDWGDGSEGGAGQGKGQGQGQGQGQGEGEGEAGGGGKSHGKDGAPAVTHYSRDLQRVVSRMLTVAPANRPGIGDILCSPEVCLRICNAHDSGVMQHKRLEREMRLERLRFVRERKIAEKTREGIQRANSASSIRDVVRGGVGGAGAGGRAGRTGEAQGVHMAGQEYTANRTSTGNGGNGGNAGKDAKEGTAERGVGVARGTADVSGASAPGQHGAPALAPAADSSYVTDVHGEVQPPAIGMGVGHQHSNSAGGGGTKISIPQKHLRVLTDPVLDMLTQIQKLTLVSQLPPTLHRDERRQYLNWLHGRLFASNQRAGSIKAHIAKLIHRSPEAVDLTGRYHVSMHDAGPGPGFAAGVEDGVLSYANVHDMLEDVLRETGFYVT